MTIDIESIVPGETFLKVSIVASKASVQAYHAAIGIYSQGQNEEGVIPPTAVSAMAITEAITAIGLPPGSIHTAQELQFITPIQFNDRLNCTARMIQNATRNGNRFLTIDFSVECHGEISLTGRSSILIPLEQ